MKRCSYEGCKNSPYPGGGWPSADLTVALVDGRLYCPEHYDEVGRYDSALAPSPLRRKCLYCDELGYYRQTKLLGPVWLCPTHSPLLARPGERGRRP